MKTKDLKELEKMGAIEKISKTKAFKQLLKIDNEVIKELKEDLKDLQEDKDDLQNAFDTLILENNRLRAEIDKLQLALNIEREWSKRVEAESYQQAQKDDLKNKCIDCKYYKKECDGCNIKCEHSHKKGCLNYYCAFRLIKKKKIKGVN